MPRPSGINDRVSRLDMPVCGQFYVRRGARNLGQIHTCCDAHSGSEMGPARVKTPTALIDSIRAIVEETDKSLPNPQLPGTSRDDADEMAGLFAERRFSRAELSDVWHVSILLNIERHQCVQDE
jgi:hypothetical protein